MKNGKYADRCARGPDAEDAGQRAGDDEDFSSRVVESGDDDEEEEEDEEGEGADAGYVDDLNEVREGSSVGVQCVQAPGGVLCPYSCMLMLVVLAKCLRPRRTITPWMARRSARATRVRPATPPSWSKAAAAARDQKGRSRPPGRPPPTSTSTGASQKSTQRWRHERCPWSTGSILSAPHTCICMHM